MRAAALALSAVFAAGCARAPEPPPPLQKAVRSAALAPPCDAKIPMEWPASWPVPTGGKGGREFDLFFYPMAPTQGGKFWIGAPLGYATLEAGGAVTACRRLSGEPQELSARRWPEAAAALTVEEFMIRARRLYQLSEEVGALYAGKRTLSPPESAKAKEYSLLFQSLAEPELQPYYRALNPDFWIWLAKAG